MSSLGQIVRFELPHDSPWFAGHFPGRPIFPGVAHLAVIDRLLREELGGGWIASVDPLRVPERVGPGEALEYTVARPGEGGRAGFTVRRGGLVVAEGTVGWREKPEDDEKSWVGRKEQKAEDGPGGVGPPRAGDPRAALPTGVRAAEDSFATQPSSQPSGAAPPLPHEGPARMAQDVLDAGPGWVVARGAVDPASAFVEAGRVPAFALLELAAQAAALLEATERVADGGGPGPRIGYLVRIRRATFTRGWVPAGAGLVARVELAGGAAPLSLYQASVRLDDEAIATGSLGTYLPAA